jgi:hypothetical protein
VGWCLVKHRDNFTLPYLAIILDAMWRLQLKELK